MKAQKFENYRFVCSLERNTPQQDDGLQSIEKWAPIVVGIPCHREHTAGSEFRRGRQMDATTTWLVRMRHPQESFQITAMDRLAFYDRTLQVSVPPYDPEGDRAQLFVECKEIDNG